MRFLVWVVVLVAATAAQAEDDIFAFTPPPDTGFVETPFGPAPAIRDWRKDTPEALVRGIKAYDGEDYETAKKYLVPLADAGHAVAQNYVGRMHDDRPGFGADILAACDLYKLSGNLGYGSGQFNLGTCFLTGKGRHQNGAEAVKWLTPKAEAGDNYAQFKIASAYFKMKEHDSFVTWMKRSADNGSLKAVYVLEADGLVDPERKLSVFDKICIKYAQNTGKPFDYCDD